jgi:X-X-X-Leu-X-X-Gly heptad repeat protein
MAFPASVSAVEMGSKLLSECLGKADGGLTMMVLGLGALDANGKPMKAMSNGKPASILYAMEYLQDSIDGQLVPGIKQIQEGTGKIGSGAGDAKEAIATGLQTFESIPVIVSSLEENAAQADTFLGKPEGAQGTVMYVFQTPEVSKQANAMKYGLGVIAVALIVLIALRNGFSAGTGVVVKKEKTGGN